MKLSRCYPRSDRRRREKTQRKKQEINGKKKSMEAVR